MSKVLIDKNDEVDLEVTSQDQKMINLFGRLNNRKHELLKMKAYKQEALEKSGDARDEIFLADDDAKFNYTMGQAFLETDKVESETLVERFIEKLETEIKQIDSEVSAINSKHQELKVLLYAKFKNSINLEE
ncbi:prefoldin beta-like domain containing protein [Tieghemostelium lacteum]|uniref:Prefoldin subunit 4 n=1 Tax=Tieghemostelium lacteum TaxID=361077 RepID=A0A151ZDJ5_TIELA|nr:prefoldin beta-like domain containing protein [Tieghemostelium lacteum]|eukprot:KYQ92032.1 prefoldin beta-like domain containing protein [Tieghemostelium lacteum]